jgi:predicted secreted protein
MIRYSIIILFILQICAAFGQDSLNYITAEQTKIEVKVNETFIIKLRACHSCGYHWTLNQIDTLNLKLVEVTSKNKCGRVQQIGGDVFEYWKFIGVSVGTYNLEFVQKGPAKEYKENGRCNFELWVN